MKAKASKRAVEKIALERIHRLFELAEKAFESHPERSNRYVELARRIGTRNKARIPAELKQRFCKKCNAFLVSGKNALVENKKGFVEIKCLECNNTFKRKAS